MRQIPLILVVLLAVGNHLWGLEAKGLLIYTDHPSTFIECCEYNTLDTGKPVYSTIVRVDGERLQISSGGLWIPIEYPPSNSEDDITEQGNGAIQRIGELKKQFPSLSSKLLAVQLKWKNALEFSKQRNAANVSKPLPLAVLIVDGTEYDQVVLTRVENDKVSITHSAGGGSNTAS